MHIISLHENIQTQTIAVKVTTVEEYAPNTWMAHQRLKFVICIIKYWIIFCTESIPWTLNRHKEIRTKNYQYAVSAQSCNHYATISRSCPKTGRESTSKQGGKRLPLVGITLCPVSHWLSALWICIKNVPILKPCCWTIILMHARTLEGQEVQHDSIMKLLLRNIYDPSEGRILMKRSTLNKFELQFTFIFKYQAGIEAAKEGNC